MRNLGAKIPVTDGGTGQGTALAARSSSGLNIESATGHGDSDYTILSTDRWIYTNAAFTAARTWTLPLANSVNPGEEKVIEDLQQTLTATNTLSLARAGSDTINGGTGSIVLNVAGVKRIFVSDGISKWASRAVLPFGTAAGQAVSLDSNAKLPAVDGSALTNVFAAPSSWTPALKFGGNAVGLTYANQVGLYVQHNKLIIADFAIQLSAKGSSAGAATIEGLPATAIATGGNVSISLYLSMGGMSAPVSFVNGSSTSIDLYMAGAANIVAMDNTNFTDGSYLYGIATYFIP